MRLDIRNVSKNIQVNRLLMVGALFLFAPSSALSQTAGGVAGISGVVRDSSGAVVPNATVVVSNDALGIVRNLVTNEAGVFTAPAIVPAGGYRLRVNASGFAAYEANDLQLQVGASLNVNVTLEITRTIIDVDMGAAAGVVEDTRTGVSQVIGTREIVDLPINGRRVDSFVLLTPGVTNDGTFGLLTFRGIAGGNSFLLDGGDSTEQYYNENGGRTRISSQISQDAVQEFQVLSANFSAEYGRASGGVVNTVTRSGSNDFHGTAYWFFRNRTLNARDRYAAINPPEVRHQAGFSAGGAILKNKLFYFLNFDITRRDFPISSSINRPGVIDGTTQQFIGCTAPATPAQCSAINSILTRHFGLINRQANQELGFGKLDWRPTERNTFSASMNYLHFVSPNGIQSAIAATNGSAVGSNGDDSVRVRNATFNWTSIPRATAVNQFRFSWFTDRQADTFDQGLLSSGIGLGSLTVAGQANLGAGANYLPRVAPNEQRFQFADNLTWTKGKHTMKFGADIASTRDYSYNIQNAFGAYTYQTVTDYALDFSGNTSGAKHWQSYQQTFGPPVIDTTIRDYGFYAQDQYRVRQNLTLTYGMRYEYAQLPQPTIFNPDYPQTGQIHSSNLNFAPRVGLAYSFDHGKMVLRAGYGMFHARFQGALLNNLYGNNGVYQWLINLQGSKPGDLAGGPVYPNALTSVPASAKGSSSIQFLEPNARTPYSEQGSIGLERQLMAGMNLNVSYIWSRGIQLLGVRDLNLGLPTGSATYTINDTGGNAVGSYATPVYLQSNIVDPRYLHVYQDENGLNSYYNALAVQWRKAFTHGFQANASYTWAHSIDYNVGGGNNALFYSGVTTVTVNGNYKFDKGSGTLDQRHRFVFGFVEQPTFVHRDGAFYKYVVNNWQLSGITTLASGRPLTATVLVQDTPVTGMAFNNTLNGFGGNFRVPFWPLNNLYTPPTYRADLRLSKILPFSERWKLYLMFEVFNISNSQVDTALNTQAYTEKGRVLTPTPGLGIGTQSAGFPDGTNARRAQVGARVVF
jgi:Carboxypeptidase regulatory-like domain/TonB dependent receptor